MLTLTSDPVGARNTEKAVQKLFFELFKTFFTGVPHASDLGSVTFPVCDLFFNQTQLPTPGTRPQIHTVFTEVRPHECRTAPAEMTVNAAAIVTFFVRVSNQGAEGKSADNLCRRAADNLREIFQSSDRGALTQKGIFRPRIQRGPIPLSSVGFQTRMMTLGCDFHYHLPMPTTAPATPEPDHRYLYWVTSLLGSTSTALQAQRTINVLTLVLFEVIIDGRGYSIWMVDDWTDMTNEPVTDTEIAGAIIVPLDYHPVTNRRVLSRQGGF